MDQWSRMMAHRRPHYKHINPNFITSSSKAKKRSSAVGKEVLRIHSQCQNETVTVEQILEEYKHKYAEEMSKSIEAGAAMYPDPFYVVVMQKKEPWSELVLRNWFVPRQTKPDPKDMRLDYPLHSHTVYEINCAKGKLEVLWTLPIAQDCVTIMANAHLYDPQLVSWIKEFSQGTLGQEYKKV